MADVLVRDQMELHQLALRPNALVVLLHVARAGGEARMSHGHVGMSRQEFRTAVDYLRCNQLATSRATNQGTVVGLGTKRVIEPLTDGKQPTKQPTSNQPATNQPPNGSSDSSLTPPLPKEKTPKGVKKKAVSPRKSRLPEDWKPQNSEYAAEHGIDPDAAILAFKDWAISKGHLYADWERTWQSACRSWLKERNLPPPVVAPDVANDELEAFLQSKPQYLKIYQKHINNEPYDADLYRELCRDARAS